MDTTSQTKQWRKDLDAILQSIKASTSPKTNPLDTTSVKRSSRERSLAVTKLQECIMWLGMDLKAISEEMDVQTNPYPHSYDPSSPIIDKTADGLKL